MSKKILSMFLVLAMIFTMIPTTVFAIEETSISLDLEPEIFVGQEYEFDYWVIPVAEDMNKTVATVFNFSNANYIESFYAWDHINEEWDKLTKDEHDAYVFNHVLSNLDQYGNIQSKIKIKFAEDANIGQEDLFVVLETTENNEIVQNGTLATTEMHFATKEMPKSNLVTDIMGAQITAGEWYEFGFILNAVPGDVGKKVVAISEFDKADQIEALEYWEVVDSSWKTMPLDGQGHFGDSDGFEIPVANTDLESKFRVKFKNDAEVGTYSFVAKVMLMNGTTVTDTVICDVSANFDVLAPEEEPSTLTTSINGATLKPGDIYEFDFTLNAKASDAGKKVIAISTFDGAENIESLEYFEVADSSWKALPLDGDGKFGGNGFEMPAVDYSAVSEFRVKFKDDAEIGRYTFTVELKLMNGDEITDTILCSTLATFDIVEPAPVEKSNAETSLGDELVAGEWNVFTVTFFGKPGDAGRTFSDMFHFGDDLGVIDGFEVWNDDTDTWQGLQNDGEGHFSTGETFTMPSESFQMVYKFRIKPADIDSDEEYFFHYAFNLDNPEDSSDNYFFMRIKGFKILSDDEPLDYQSTLSNNLNGDTITVGEWHEFSFTLDAKADDAGINVVGVSNFANADDIEAIEYWDEASSSWMNLMMDGDGNFGASTGFPLPGVDVQVESKFRVKFKETATLGDHSFTAKLMVVDGTTVTDEMVCETTATFTLVGTSVTPPIEGASTLTTDIDGDAIALDTWHEFTFTLNGSAEDAGKKVVGVSQFSDVDIIDALEYLEVADNSWKNLLLDTDGAFGAAEGFDMPAVDFEATSKFRVKFKHPDTIKDSYSFVVQMKVVEGTTVTDTVLCETTATFTIDHAPVIDMTKWVEDETGHWHGATCSCTDKVQFAEHIASDWIIDKEAKVGVKGEKHKECTVCGRVLETAEIPAKSGGGGGGGSTIRTSNIDIRSDDKEIQYRASIVGNSVTISMSSSELKKIINKNIDVGMIVVDLASANKEIEKVTMSKGNLQFFLDSVKDTDIEGLTIMFENGLDIVLNMNAIEHLLEETNKDITFFAEEQTNKDLNTKQKNAVEKMTILGYYEAYIAAGNTYIGGFKDGSATLHVTDEILGKYDFHGLGAYSLNNDGETSKVRVYYYDDIELTIGENSDYVVVYDKDNVVKTCPKNNSCPIHKFMDVNTYGWYHDGLHYAVDNGLMVGYSDTQFGPDDAITRGQIVTILWRMENSPVVNYAMSFKDVKSDAYYADAVRWAQANKIVSGYNAESFGPDDVITREQMVTIMQRYAEFKDMDVTTDKSDTLREFKDYAQISDWAVNAVKWAVDNGIIAGFGDGILGPLGTTTRAQAATIMQRFCQEFCK